MIIYPSTSYKSLHHLKKNKYFQLAFATKISFVMLDKSHETLVANDKGYWMKEKVNKYNFILWFHCICIVTYNYDVIILVTIEANDVLAHVLILNYLKYYYYYYFGNNLGHSIQMFGWFYIMTRGPMWICHVTL